jgi:hypothetical protein
MNKILLLSSLICISVAASASGNPVSVSHMRSYSAEFEYFTLREDGSLEKAGEWTDSVEVDDARIVRSVTRKPLGREVDLVRVVAADKHSLAPIHLTQRFGAGLAGVYHTQVQGEQITQFFMPDNKTPARVESAQIPTGILEINLQGIFAAALPMEPGQISIDGYSGGAKPSGQTMVFDVLGQEKVMLNEREFSAWKVHQPQTNWTYWVRKESPYLLKVSHPSPDGSTLVSLLVHHESK